MTKEQMLAKREILEKQQKIAQLKEKKNEYQSLPHRYGFKFYKWSRELYESREPINLLCAANQISKSSTAIRKCIEMAGNPKCWPSYWKTQPRQFWYLYPSREVATVEVQHKWEPEFLPRGDYKDHPTWGWRSIHKHGGINEIAFNSGVSIYFKAYSQGTGYNKLQTGTCHAIFVDEELPENLYDELYLRLAATDGIFVAVFTATMGQELWFRAIERIGHTDESFVGAWKKQVSMYDCLKYEDGTDTPWTFEKIARIKAACATEQEVKRRVFGRFVVDSGLTYPSFTATRNTITEAEFRKKHKRTEFGSLVPKEWHVYSGTDIGGGGDGHPAAVTFIAVKPDYKYGVVFKCWRGAKGILTTSSDILDKYRMLRGKLKPVIQTYDWQAKDYFTYASRLSESFVKAEKSHDIGEDLLNVLFKNQMLDILLLDGEDEAPKMIQEFTSLTKNTSKQHAKDDLIDSCRYCATAITWDYTDIMDEFCDVADPKKIKVYSEIEERRRAFMGGDKAVEEIKEEIDYFNELYG